MGTTFKFNPTTGLLDLVGVNAGPPPVGILPVANGGTASGTALNNNRVMASIMGGIVEAPAIAGNKALISDANGLPIASATDATELGYVSGVTSSIQTQLNATITGTSVTTFTNKTFDADGTGNSISNIENADIKAAAAIALNKLAATTVSRALVSDSSGFVSPATTTAAEIGFVNGVTSSIQTQIDSKQPTGSYITASSVDTLTNKTFDADGTGNSISNIENADIKAAAAIALNKLAATTGSRALVSTAGGFVTAATTTSTEIGFVNGVTSAIQTQLNTKITASSTDTLTNKSIDAATNTITNISNAEVKAAAAIAVNKLAAVTASRALVSDGSGFVSPATTTSTEIGFINGLTSSAQTQIDTKLTNVMTTRGDLTTRDASTTVRLAAGGTSQRLITNSSGDLAWDYDAQLFGTGEDGNITISGAVSLSQITYYNTVTMAGGGVLTVTSYPLYCQVLDLTNADAGSIIANGNIGTSTSSISGGAGGALVAAAVIGGSTSGGTGGNGSTGAGGQGSSPGAATPGNGGAGGTSGVGGSATAGAVAGGITRAGAATTPYTNFSRFEKNFLRGITIVLGGGGGGGGGAGGGDGAVSGRAGGGGGAGGGVLVIFAKEIITGGSTPAGVIRCLGGGGGSCTSNIGVGTAGGGSGGGGGGGGFAYVAYLKKTGTAVTNLISAAGGTGGNAGNGFATGNGGTGGAGGAGGNIKTINLTTMTATSTAGSAGSAGGANSGTTGGTGGAGGACAQNL